MTHPRLPAAPAKPHRFARALLLLLLALVLLLPGLSAGCTPSPALSSAALDLPGCGEIPGLTEPPPPLTPLDKPAAPSLPASRAGYLPAEGHVDPTGEYQIRVPIEVLPGRAGMQPALALAYGSRGPNGHLGAGFRLDGLSEINRCPKTIATEGLADGVHFDKNDAFCLDGKKLVAIEGAHGGDGTEYRTEEDSFAKIVSYHGDKDVIERFTVWTKGGRIKEYAAVWAELPNCSGGACNDLDWNRYVFAWVLHEERDRAGNAVRYTYQVDSKSHYVYDDPRHDRYASASVLSIEYYPTSIDYTYHVSRGAEDAAALRHVQFEYEDRPDKLFQFQGGVRIETTKRLRKIALTGPAPAWTYDLFYEKSNATGYSLLQEVRRCGALGGCLPAKQLGWHSSEGPVFEESTLGLEDDDGLDAMVLDADGDGMDEVVSRDSDGQLYLRRTVHPKEPLSERTPMVSTFGRNSRPVDIDGDGAFEIVGDLLDAYRVYRWEPENHTFSVGGPVIAPIKTKGGLQNPLAFLDLDGDGLAELITADRVLCSSKNGRCWDFSFQHNDGGTFGDMKHLATTGDLVPDPWTGAFWTLGLDAFGEHRGALFYDNNAEELMPGLRGVMLDPAGEVKRVVFPPSSAPNAEDFPSSYADLNGDGLRDYLKLEKEVEKGQSRLCVYFNTGGQEQLSYLPAPTASPLFDAELRTCVELGQNGIARMIVADLDADGKEDVLLARGNLLTLVRLGADRELHPTALDVPFKRAQIGDFDGNGLLDVASWTDALFFMVQRGTGETADRLVAITDEGDGVPREKVTYSAERFDAPEDPSSCAHPLRCPRQAFTVASKHEVREGKGYQSLSYRYEAPRFDVHGRGFLGFGTVRVWEPSRAAETVTTYDNVTSDGGRYPRAFRPTMEQRAVAIEGKSGTARLARSTYEDKPEHLNGDKSWVVHPSAFTTLEWEEEVTVDASEGKKVHITGIDGADEHDALRVRHGSMTYDDYGNPLEVTVSTLHGKTEKTVTTYEIRLDDWLISLPKTVTVSLGSGDHPAASHLAYDYDLRGYLCRAYVEKDDVDPDIPMVTSYAHDQEGLVRAVTLSAAGVPARTAHIAYGGPDRVFPSERWNELGHAQWMVYDQAFGAVLDAEDANGRHVRAQIDDLGRPLSVEPEGSAATAFSYEPRISESGALSGFRVVATSDTGAVSRSDYDARGRVVGQGLLGFDGTFIESRVTYDALGRVHARSRPGFGAPSSSEATYTYDSLDRVVTETRPGGAEILYTHSFFETHEADSMLHARAILRDVDDRVIESTEIVDGKKLVTHIEYGDFDRVLTVADPLGNQVVAAYDRRGRRIALSDPDAGSTITFYNGLGDTRAEVKNGAAFTTYALDVLGRVVQIEDDDGLRSFTWDASAHGIGRLAHRESPDGIVEDFTYDDLGRPKEQNLTAGGETLSFGQGYDALGRPSELRYPAILGKAPLKIGRAYGQNGQLARVFEVGGIDPLWKAEVRNEEGRLLQASLGNGLVLKRAYEEESGRLSAVDEGAALSLTYDYNFDGQVHHKHDLLAKRVETYDYDALHRLTRWTLSSVLPGAPGFPEQTPAIHDTAYHYDDLGNLTQVDRDNVFVEQNTYGEDGRPHALTSTLKGSFVYDDRGRQKKAPDRSVIFAEHDRPKSVFTAEGETHFTYDAMGNRIGKTGPGRTVLTFGGLYERRTIEGKTQHIFTVEGGEGPALQLLVDAASGTRTMEYLHRDPLGSVGAVTGKSGAPLHTRYYEPFGALRDLDGEPLAPVDQSLPLGFTGHHNDGDLGLIDMKGREYDPSTRRFLTPDPHVSSPFSGQAYNRYSYAANDPINLSDPTGFDIWSGEYGCIGLECMGGGGWDGTILGDSQWIEQGVDWKWPTGPSFSAGMSSPKRWTMGAVLATEGRRTVGMPIGPTAAGSTRGGPNAPPRAGQMSAGRLAERIAIRGLLGFGNAWYGFGKLMVLNAVTFGGYSTFSLLSSMWGGYNAATADMADKVAGALNGANPLYHIGKMGADAYLAMEAGDYETVADVGGNVLGMVSIVAAGGGAGAAEGAEAEGLAAGEAGGLRPTFGNLFPGDVPPGRVAGTLEELQAAETTGTFDFVAQGGRVTLGEGHPYLAGGGRVDYAGSITLSEGQIIRWTNGSGHYRPAAQFAEQAGLPMSSFTRVQIPAFGGPVLQLPVFQ